MKSGVGAQIGIVEFSDTTKTLTPLTGSLSTALAAIGNAGAAGGGTWVSGGLALGMSVVNGAGSRPGVPRTSPALRRG